MRTKYDLYINGQKADINNDALVLMNYKLTDSESPAAVYNSRSQQLALPKTSRNNVIFDHIYRADHTTQIGKFNALQRTPFEIISEQGEKLECGYLKLTEINDTQYTVVLYGGLGGFLFSLMYNADGSKKSLADLQYFDDPIGGDDELNFNITRDAVREAWRTIGGLQAHSDLWNIINFAPCYNGVPGGDFDAKKAFCYNGCYGVKASDSGYSSRRNHVMVDLVNEVDEWGAQDLRSYQQRPVISIKALFEAIQRWATANGYTFTYTGIDFFSNANPYFWKSWLTLPKLDSIQLPNESGSGTGTFNGPDPGAQPTFGSNRVADTIISGPWNNKGYTAKHSVSVTFVPKLNTNSLSRLLAAWEVPDSLQGRRYWRIVTAYQLLALDGNGVVLGGSKVAMATTKTICSDGATPKETTVAPATFVSKYNNAIGTHPTSFSPSWTPEDGDVYESTMHNGKYYDNKRLTGDDLAPMEITLSFDDVVGVRDVRLRTTYLAVYSEIIQSDVRYYQVDTNVAPEYNYMESTQTVLGLSFMDNATDSYSYSVSGTAHSGSLIGKKTLLGGTHTPADYLLSYCKMFGLYFIVDESGKNIEIRQRNTAYHSSDAVLDIQKRVDLPSVKVVPYVIRSRWYDWVQEASGRFAEYYKSIYGQDYGMARVNTGFEFDADHTDVLNGSALKGAAEVLHQSKYFENITENKDGNPALCPSPFIDGGSFTLWNSSGETLQQDIVTPTDAATIDYINPDFLGYDNTMMPKPEFCDKDGKEQEGEDVLLMFDTSMAPQQYERLCLTDDNGLMTLYNEGKPCWLLGQAAIASNLKYTINDDADAANKLYIPRFRRMISGSSNPMSVTLSLDMAVPQEIDQPEITVPQSAGVFYRYWKNYMTDRLNVDAKVMTCKVDLRGLQVGRNLIGRICFFDGSLWALESIKNYVLGGDDLTECEFVKVNDKNNYITGHN